MNTTSPFIVNAMELATAPQDFDVQATAEELNLNQQDFSFVEPVRGQLSWRWVDGRVVLTGRLSTRAQATCVRCLGEAHIPVASDIHVIFTDEPLVETDPFDLDDEDDAGLVHFHGERIDARDEVRDILLLETPELPICSAQCRGLCARCGADLNAGPCSCPPLEQEKAKPEAKAVSASWRDQLDQLRKKLE